tara:strand:+ start:5152 stop:5625 length:474 start_codon:yes stop_codon:yes gene_type:complete
LGFVEDDALFPAETDLKPPQILRKSGNIPVMNSIHAISNAFRSASEPLGKRFTPHSAKHFIGVLGIRRCKRLEQQAAWSANMVHSDIETTRRYYQKLSQDRIDDVFESLEQTSGSDLAPEDMMIMLRYHEHSLTRGTPEFQRGKALISEHYGKGTFE